MKVYSYYFKSESCDEYEGGSWLTKPTPEELAKFIIYEHWGECESWLSEEGKNYEWAIQNPIEALKMCLIQPDLNDFEISDKIPDVPLKMEE